MKIGVTRRHTSPLVERALQRSESQIAVATRATGTIVSHGNNGPSDPESRPNVAGKHTSASADQNA